MRVSQYRLPPDIAVRVRAGHPWVFRDALGRDVTEATGAVVELISGNREFVTYYAEDGSHDSEPRKRICHGIQGSAGLG